MAMKLLAFHDQLIANLSADNDDNNLVPFYIIQRTKAADTQFEFYQRVRP
jgi:hypothetical protein